jgi:hypothetical protein
VQVGNQLGACPAAESWGVVTGALSHTAAVGEHVGLPDACEVTPKSPPLLAWVAALAEGGTVIAVEAWSIIALGTYVDMAVGTQPAPPVFLLARVLGHAPRPLRRRIHVIPAPPWRSWTSMLLADAACWVLGRAARSVHLWVIYTLGFFCVYLTLAFIESEPARATATMVLVLPVAPLPPSPTGTAGGASLVARTTTPPAAVVAATRISAGSPVTHCTVTRTSPRTVDDYGRGSTPACQATSYSTWRMRRTLGCADLALRRHDARLPALVVAAVDCCSAWARASSSKDEEGG